MKLEHSLNFANIDFSLEPEAHRHTGCNHFFEMNLWATNTLAISVEDVRMNRHIRLCRLFGVAVVLGVEAYGVYHYWKSS